MATSNTQGGPESPAQEAPGAKHSALESSFPVLLPYHAALFLPESEFQDYLKQTVSSNQAKQHESPEYIRSSHKRHASQDLGNERMTKGPFVQALEDHDARIHTPGTLAAENKTLTENSDVTFISANNPLVDLFYDLKEHIEPQRLKNCLEAAWKEDPLITLKIIFNARSIHLGKSDKLVAYRALGWLAENHPLTLLANLKWLVRPVIQKKPPRSSESDEKGNVAAQVTGESDLGNKQDEDDFEMIEAHPTDPKDPTKAYDVRHGVSHGYWKDLLNLVVFAANDQLKHDSNPDSLLCQHQKSDPFRLNKRKREWDPSKAKEIKRQKTLGQSQIVVNKLQNDHFYRALHFTVARLFAEQLKEDEELLKSSGVSRTKDISLAAKWSPTFGSFHDKHTFILSSISELLYPQASLICPDADNRELYLRYARENVRMYYTSPLRKALSVVEREISDERFADVKYERVPSLAMKRYARLFMQKDFEHFSDYIKRVSTGDAKISGATLLPSTLVQQARETLDIYPSNIPRKMSAVKREILKEVNEELLNGQWKTLVQRVKDSGALQSSIAVCDISGSMLSPEFKDKTNPMDSAIGLSLLVSESTAPPFGGGFITFSERPKYMSIGEERNFTEQVRTIVRSHCYFNTNFVAVFEDVILPMAIENKLKPEDMVKQVFVFSDMQFDEADRKAYRWTSSYQRIKKAYEEAGYEMPRLIFWNLAADSSDKPVTMDDENTALVSGYSQGMLKVFLDNGGFEAEGEEEAVTEMVDDEAGMMEVKVKTKVDPLTLVKKAVSHQAYSMLQVVD